MTCLGRDCLFCFFPQPSCTVQPCPHHQVAFGTVHSAVLFCLEAQYRLLEAAWPKEVLKLANCREVFAADGSLLFRGPRVRMGIHWAAEGTIAHRC